MRGNHVGTTEMHADGITIRRLGDEDLKAVERLAQLESRRPPEGALLGVEIDERLVAAISLATGESMADPFSRTGELRALLELRAAQLLRRRNGHRRLRRRHPRPKARAALAGGPPGAARFWPIAQRSNPS
jgi:hypothetical protein